MELSIFRNQNFYIALVSLIIFLFTLIKYFPLLKLGISLKENTYTPIIALVLLASLISLIISIKNIKKEEYAQ